MMLLDDSFSNISQPKNELCLRLPFKTMLIISFLEFMVADGSK